MVRIPHRKWSPSRAKSKNFRLSLDFLNSYAENMESSIKLRCQALANESEAIKEEFEDIEVTDYDDRHSKDPDVDVDFDFEHAWHKEDLQFEYEDKRHEAEMYATYYSQIFFESLFITIYSLFERYLDDLCNDARGSWSLTLKPKDLSGKGIKRSQAYLKKVARLNFPDDKLE